MTIQSFCRNLASLALLFVFAQAQEVQTLTPSQALEREIASGQTHTLRIALQAGQFVHFAIEQLSCDVSVTLTAPDGKKITAELGIYGLREALSEEAATTGDYQLSLRNQDAPYMKGRYRLQADVKPTPTANDRKRMQAERMLIELSGVANPQQALEKLQPILQLWRDIGDRYWEGVTLGAMAARYTQQQNWAKGEEYAERAIAIMREVKMPVAEVWYLQRLATSQRNQQRIEQPLATLRQALDLARQTKQRNLEADILVQLGNVTITGQSEYEKGAAYYEQAKTIYREISNVAGETSVVNMQGLAAQRLRKYDEAQSHFEAALAMARNQKNKAQEASFLQSLGQLHRNKNQLEQSVMYYEQAIQLWQELKNHAAEAQSLLSYGLALRLQKQYDKSLSAFERFLAISRERNNLVGQVQGLGYVGISHAMLGSFEKASESFEQLLQLSAGGSNPELENLVLFQLGSFLSDLRDAAKVSDLLDKLIAASQSKNHTRAESLFLYETGYKPSLSPQQHISYQERALELAQRNRNRNIEASCLSAIASRYDALADYENSVKYTLRSLEVSREVKERYGEIDSLLSLGTFYSNLGHYDKATPSFEQALAKAQEYKSQDIQSKAYMDLGWHYARIGAYDKVIAMHDKALAYFREWKYNGAEVTQLTLLAKVYILKGEYEKSLEFLQQARNRAVESQEPFPRPNIPYLFGEAYRGLGKYELAISYHQQAIPRTSATDAAFLWNPYLGLMKDYDALNLPQPAIFWGKQAVNSIQDLRQNVAKLDRDVQQNFLKSKEDIYRSLADLLIANGRLPEAEQVIRMLKDEEYFDYIRRDVNNSPKGEKATLTPEEAALDKRYREIADNLTAIGSERSALLEKKDRTPEENLRLTKLEADLSIAAQQFQRFLDGLGTEMTKSKDAIVRYSQVSDAQGLQADLRELGKGVAALYTVVGEDKYSVILTTADVQKAYQTPIKAADLNRKILAFRTALQNPKLDPLPLAQELYKILLAPVEQDLRAMKAETLMWSLDGVLRYVPMTALHDGEKYLVERYRQSVFTPVSNARLKDTPSRHWQALGLGVTRSFGANIPALPGVAEEMRGIIKAEGSATGVLPGTIKLDEQFTQESMLAGLREQKTVVHIASHFQFKPGNETASALLLGDGKFLSLAQIKVLANPFGGVELLTLSACDTATGGVGANGNEIEGFGALAQTKGAKAVVASLWPVADRSTKSLMQEFYRLRETGSAITKVEALRQAQLKLMRGNLVTEVDLTKREIVHETDKTSNLPKFKNDPKKPFAHPYYWAPFILIGNWK